MRKLLKELENRKIDYSKLLTYGFVYNQGFYSYKKLIYDDKFEVRIKIVDNMVFSSVIEVEFNDEYILVDVFNSQGGFVGKIKEEYEAVIKDFINHCTIIYIFKAKQSNIIINYIREKYHDELEYLWKKFPKNAIWRNKQNNKWYGAILTISAHKIGLDSKDEIEILDLRYPSLSIEQIIDNINIFPGYHMNKKNWITVKLDESIDNNTLFRLIDISFNLSINAK